MILYMDTEFTGLHQKTTLISIALVGDVMGKPIHFYAELTDYDKNQVDNWIEFNVISKLTLPPDQPNFKLVNASDYFEITKPKYLYSIEMRGTTAEVKDALINWLGKFNQLIEIWSDCLSYDWVLFCEIFGGAMKVPKCVYYIPFDICTLLREKGVDADVSREDFAYGPIMPNTPQPPSQKHNALHDAWTIKRIHEKLSMGLTKHK